MSHDAYHPLPLLERVPPAPGTSSESVFDAAAIDQSIPERFEQQARAQANRLAIRWPRGRYDYADLNATANRLAHAILARRGESTGPIALLFDHGGEAVAAMLAVLKAARCYVVLDPGYPRE